MSWYRFVSRAVSRSRLPQERFWNFLRYTKTEVSPANVVSIFLFLLTNGAANRTGKREKSGEELIPL